jgi:hypothetical protein
MEGIISSEDEGPSVSQGTPPSYGSRKFITVITDAALLLQ